MRRALSHYPAGRWPSARAVATVTLGFDDRYRRRIRLDDDDGEPFLLDLPEAVVLGDGDGLALDGGGYLRVCAAAEEVLDVRGYDAGHTARLAWHIGNRHIPLQVLAGGVLRIRRDHVLAAMLKGLGAMVTERRAPFTPEPGAYAGSHGNEHSHAHAHAHAHDHG